MDVIEGETELSSNLREMAILSLSEAVEILRAAYFGVTHVPIDAALVRASQSSQGNVPNVHHLIGPLEDLGTLYCESDRLEGVIQGTETLRTALLIRRTLLEAERQWKADHAELVRTASQAAVCAWKARMTTEAQSLLHDAGSLLGVTPTLLPPIL